MSASSPGAPVLYAVDKPIGGFPLALLKAFSQSEKPSQNCFIFHKVYGWDLQNVSWVTESFSVKTLLLSLLSAVTVF